MNFFFIENYFNYFLFMLKKFHLFLKLLMVVLIKDKLFMSFDRYYKLLIFSPPQTKVIKKYFRKKEKR